LQQCLVQRSHVGEAGFEGHGGDPEVSGQAPHQAIAEEVKLPGVVDQLAEGDHPGIRDRWTQRLEVSATGGVGSSEWGGVGASPRDEEQSAGGLLCNGTRADRDCGNERCWSPELHSQPHVPPPPQAQVNWYETADLSEARYHCFYLPRRVCHAALRPAA
jgi:hypothetical protein